MTPTPQERRLNIRKIVSAAVRDAVSLEDATDQIIAALSHPAAPGAEGVTADGASDATACRIATDVFAYITSTKRPLLAKIAGMVAMYRPKEVTTDEAANLVIQLRAAVLLGGGFRDGDVWVRDYGAKTLATIESLQGQVADSALRHAATERDAAMWAEKYGLQVRIADDLRMQVAALSIALDDAAGWFREYELIHLAKNPSDLDKAYRNEQRALACEKALTATPTASPDATWKDGMEDAAQVCRYMLKHQSYPSSYERMSEYQRGFTDASELCNKAILEKTAAASPDAGEVECKLCAKGAMPERHADGHMVHVLYAGEREIISTPCATPPSGSGRAGA